MNKPWKFRSDNLAELLGPVNDATGAPIVAATAVKARLFHDKKDSRLTITGASPDVILNVTRPERYRVNRDFVLVWMNDGTWHEGGLVTAVDRDAGTITITTALPGNTNRDHMVCVGLGGAIGTGTPWEIAMNYFQPAGGAVAGNFDYGWRCTVPYTQAALEIAIPVRVEIDLDASAGVRLLEVQRTYITGGL